MLQCKVFANANAEDIVLGDLILLDAFAEGRAHVLWWVGDDINFSPKFLLELMGEFVKRAERHGVAAG